MKSILPILICIVMIVSFIITPFCEGEFPSKTIAILCTIVCLICIFWAAWRSSCDDDRIEKLESKIKELEKEINEYSMRKERK